MTNIYGIFGGEEKKTVAFNALMKDLQNKVNPESVKELFSLPCMAHEYNKKADVLINLLGEKEHLHLYIEMLCSLLQHNPDIMHDCERLSTIHINLKNMAYLIERADALNLASCFEQLFAKGIDVRNVLCVLFESMEINPNIISAEDVYIQAALLAYSCNRFNFSDKFNKLKHLKRSIETAEFSGLHGMIYYYYGICKLSGNDNEKDSSYYMFKSRNYGFYLADIYLDYPHNSFETPKERP